MHNAVTPNSPPVKTSDFISLREFRRRGIYCDFYGPLGLDYLMTAKVPSNPEVQVAVAVLRSGRDFSERERRLLAILQPHLLQAYRNAEFRGDNRRALTLLQQAAGELGLGLIELWPNGGTRRITPLAHAWLEEFFPGNRATTTGLPSALAAWLRTQLFPAIGAAAIPEPRRPFAIERDGRRLTAHLVEERGASCLCLEVRQSRPSTADIAGLGLTRRESEVLTWVAAGKTNSVIATILDLSPRTVQHTLERIYAKLGVQNRVAAVACAFDAGRASAGDARPSNPR